MSAINIFILLTIGLFSCNADKSQSITYENKIPLTQEILISEWMIDSIYGSSESIQDWIYFTPDNKFWRCSRSRGSYILDSCLNYDTNKITRNQSTVYNIYSVDTNNILLESGENQVFHCRRWNEFDQEDITRFVHTNPTKKLLNGRWNLDSSEIIPTALPSYCDRLLPGSKFVFNPNGRLEVFPKDSINKCNNYSYHIWDNKISMREYDMGLELDIVTITKNKMTLKSTYKPEGRYSGGSYRTELEGHNLYFTKEKEKNSL